MEISWGEEKKRYVVWEIITGNCHNIYDAVRELSWKNEPMMIVCVEGYKRGEKDIPRLSELISFEAGAESLYTYYREKREILLIRGHVLIDRMKKIIQHYRVKEPQEGSQLGKLFITYGNIVKNPVNINESYEIAKNLADRRFYSARNEHVLGPEKISLNRENYQLTFEEAGKRAEKFSSALHTHNRLYLNDQMRDLERYILDSSADEKDAKLFLLNVFTYLRFNMKAEVKLQKDMGELPEKRIFSVDNLYEGMEILSQALSAIMNTLGDSNKEGVLNDILYYIQHNYSLEMRLERLAPLFGYNSAYLGKLFRQGTGMSFNVYIDHVRMDRAKEMLEKTDKKVYEISELVGFKNVDYFHIKFQKYVGVSPVEYRKKVKTEQKFDMA